MSNLRTKLTNHLLILGVKPLKSVVDSIINYQSLKMALSSKFSALGTADNLLFATYCLIKKPLKVFLTRLTISLILLSLLISLHPAPTALAAEATSSAQTASNQEPATNTLPIVEENLPTQTQKTFAKQSEPSAHTKPKVRVKRLLKRDFRVGEKILVDLENANPRDVQAKVLDSNNREVEVRIQEIADEGLLTLKISSGSSFKPGAYTLQIQTRDGRVSEQDFTWGVLAINVNKPIYKPGETAKIALAVLDENGEMVCDAQVKLEVRSPKSEVTTLTTENKDIKVNEECKKKAFTLTPDYETSYTTGEVGNYLMTLSAVTKNGFHTVSDSFRVAEATPFEIERSAPTRIYPPSKYPVTINITANRDFTGTIKEIVPAGFEILPLEDTPAPSNSEIVSLKELPPEGELPSWAVLSLPFEGDFPVVNAFGEPVKSAAAAEKFAESRVLANDGLDFALPSGTEVLATDDGEVGLAQEDGAYGVTVVIQHEWGKSYYGYLGSLKVKLGDKVARGDIIALSDASLVRTPQLHFAIKPNKNNRDNGYFGKIDPASYLSLKDKRQIVEDGSDLQVQLVSWDVSIKNGQTITLGYNFLAPKISPAFYTLGRLSFINSNNREVFKEARFWQIASDAATYTGKHLRTIEYVLGTGGLTCNTSNNACGSDTNASARASGTPVYFGNQVNTTKATASTKNIIIQGTGIRVVQAYLEGWIHHVTAADISNFDLRLDVEGSSTAGSDSRLQEAAGLTLHDSTGPNSTVRFRGDATYLFDRQSDTDFNNGLSVVGAYTVTGPTTILGSMKLVITYEQDYSTTAHTETKTVRFPLDSDETNANGTKITACGASSTCGFSYNANIPDAAADGDIMDVWFEITGEVNSATASTIQPQISGGTAARTYPWLDVIAGQQFVNIYFRPAVGGSDFARNTAQTLNIVNGTVAVQGLGGELVVTYNYSTGASSQTETVRYFARQETGQNVGTSQSANSAVSATVSNTGMSMSNIWVKADAAVSESNTLTLSGDVGGTVDGSGDITNAVALGGTDSIRAGDTATLYLDLSAQAGDFSSATTSTDIERQYSGTSGDAAVSMELFLTFTWSGSSGGTVTKTVTFGTNQSGVGDTSVASTWRNKPMYLELPERVTKTHRSTYIGTNVGHSATTNITDSATISVGVNNTTAPANQTTATEQQDEGTTAVEENAVFTTRHDVTNTIFSGGSTISWTKRTFEVNATISAAESAWFSHEFVVTYDAALGANDPAAPAQPKHLRTVEYVLGTGGLTCNTSNNACGSDTNASTRASATVVYFGNQVHTTKATASTKNIIIQGSGIRVVQAYLEGWVHAVSATDVTNFQLMMDVEGSSTAGSDSRLQEAAGTTLIDTSGPNNTIRFRGDATYLFDRQSDTDFNNGLSVVGAYAVTGPTTILGSMKLVLTYEQNYLTTAHDETKTVRFPLDSDETNANGTKITACGASSTCGFSYTANIPDAAADGDIMDVFFEITGETNTTTASTIQPQISGGTAARTYPWLDVTAGQQFVNIYFRPNVGGSDFARSTAQTLNIVNGTVAVQGLGGELVVTYNFSTDATSQTETVRYFARQETGQNVGSSQSANSAVSTTVSNTGMTMSNIWVKADSATNETTTLTLTGDVAGTVDGSGDIANAIALGGTDSVRVGDTATLYLDLSAQAGDFSSATTSIDIERQYSGTVGDAAVSMELFLTFTWDGDGGGTVTKTVTFGTNQQGSGDSVASVWRNKPMYLELPETVTKTHRSTYIGTNITHSDGTSIVDSTTQSIGVNNTTAPANQTTTTEQQEDGTTTTEENALFTVRHNVTNTIFSGGSTISWNRRTFEVNATINQAEPAWFSHEFVVTYDAALAPITLAQNHFRWRDDSTALNTSGGYLASEDNIPTINKSTTVRVRLEVANTGGAPARDYPFQLEFAARTGGTCGDETFAAVPVTPTSEHFEMVTSSQYADQAATSSSLLTATGTFSNGRGVEDPANQTVAIDITNAFYTEVEYAVQATTNATDSATYCFRLTNVGSTTNFTYTTYAEVTIASSGPTLDQLMRHGKWLSGGTENPFTF
ncbi:MAG TPA: peptidoglycan DD-metalloendopeptidase family protein [Candidatus Nanoarchaeia archaeon]